MADAAPIPIESLALRPVLRDVSPIVARVISAPDELEISELHVVLLSMLDWVQALWIMLAQLINLAEQAFQCRPASKINDFISVFV